MKHYFIIPAFLVMAFTGCVPTRIVTYSPRPESTYYATTITPARSNVTTTVAQVYSTNEDISLHLDLQAVAALWSQSASVREFEQMLNSSSYPVSNLDLNGDGYIDYLRVLETVQGYNHVFLIQAVLADNVYQDVATLIAEVPSYTSYHVEIIGAPYIYGPNYIIRPTFIIRPLIFDIFFRAAYSPWRSPWYWGHFPSHYRHPRPIYLNHYQAYVNTYMSSHRYCREIAYPLEPHFRDYSVMTRDYQRNDYGMQHPDRAFTVRNANTPMAGSQVGSGQPNESRVVRNAYDIRMNNEASKVTTTSTPTVQRNATSATRSAGNTASQSRVTSQGRTEAAQGRNAASAGSVNQTRSTAASGARGTAGTGTPVVTRSSGSTSRSDASGSAATSRDNTIVRSRVNSSGSSSTTVTRSSSAAQSTRSSSSSTAARSSAPSSATRSSSATQSTRSSSSGSASRSSASSSSSTRSSASSSSSRSSASSASRSSSSNSASRGPRR